SPALPAGANGAAQAVGSVEKFGSLADGSALQCFADAATGNWLPILEHGRNDRQGDSSLPAEGGERFYRALPISAETEVHSFHQRPRGQVILQDLMEELCRTQA